MAFQPRKDLVDIFSTFLRFENDRAAGWLSDRHLKRNCEPVLQQPDAPNSEDFWVNQWHAIWQEQRVSATTPSPKAASPQQRMALGHLSAYVQETCFWSVRRVIRKIDSTQFQVVDGFQIAISQLPKLLKAFDPNLAGSFNAYANTAFANLVRSQLRQRREIDLCSEWRLLLKLSRKQVRETLAHAGFAAPEAASYERLWQALLENYRPGQRQSQKQSVAPDETQLQQIAATFEQFCQAAEILPETLDQQQITQRLQLLAQKARAYLYPSTRSLNMTYGDGESDLLSNLPDVAAETPMANLMIQEEREQQQRRQQQLNQVMTAAIATLDRDAQNCYGYIIKNKRHSRKSPGS